MGPVVRGRGGEQPWNRAQAPLEGGAQLENCPQALPGGGVEGRWAAVGQPSAVVEAGSGERGRGRGRGGDVRLCGAPSRPPLLRFCEWRHLQMCCGVR